MESIIQWQSPEHHFDRKSLDWYWGLGILAIAGATLAFYFNNFLFGIFIILAALTIGLLSYKETRSVNIAITYKGIVFGRRLYPYQNFRSFWIEEDHVNGPRILLHPQSMYLPLVSIHVNPEIDLYDLQEILLEFLDEEYLQESILHKWFDKLLAR